MKKLLALLSLSFMMVQALFAQSGLVKVIDGQFFRNGAPYYYIGTNFWYGPILGSTGVGGNRERLSQELDALRDMGVNNLRVLVGADAGSENANTVIPYLQPQPGALNDTLLVGLDYFLTELAKRDMVAVLYLTNSWDWSGGYGFYLKNVGQGDSPNADGKGHQAYVNYAAEFVKNDQAQQLFWNYVKTIVSRTNSITGKPYKDDPAIMAWQICNEPRSFSKEGKDRFAAFISKTAETIKQIDSKHLLSTGSEGSMGCEGDMELYERIHSDANIDYLTIHIWPANWQWCTRSTLWDDLPYVYQKAGAYIDTHMRFADKMLKPLVIEEFGYPRDANLFVPGSSTDCRDAFYSFILGRVLTSFQKEQVLAGCNFWGWAGAGRHRHKTWEVGDDYLCDPPHEPQGWYSVFDNDSTTISLIQHGTKELKTTEDE